MMAGLTALPIYRITSGGFPFLPNAAKEKHRNPNVTANMTNEALNK